MLLLPRAQPLFQRSEFTFIDFLTDFLDQVVAATARRKILLHFGVPSLFFNLLKPVGQFPALWLCELLDRCFDRFYGHTPSLTLSTGGCKSKRGRRASTSVKSRWVTGQTLHPRDSVPLPVETQDSN